MENRGVHNKIITYRIDDGKVNRKTLLSKGENEFKFYMLRELKKITTFNPNEFQKRVTLAPMVMKLRKIRAIPHFKAKCISNLQGRGSLFYPKSGRIRGVLFLDGIIANIHNLPICMLQFNIFQSTFSLINRYKVEAKDPLDPGRVVLAQETMFITFSSME